MKIIFSRKGFDSGTGKVPSPIFPDGSLVSLPIPDKNSGIEYGHIKTPNGIEMGSLVEKLTKGRIPQHYKAHLDPDLYRGSLKRERDWSPIFGQTGQAQGHLANNGIGVGDLFIFFGKFQRVVITNHEIRYENGSMPVHVIFGWLQVGRIIDVNREPKSVPKWAMYHPHLARDMKKNTLYIAAKNLSIGNKMTVDRPGAGIFRKFSPALQLTDPELKKCSIWKLPKWFHPAGRESALTFHSDMARWEKKKGYTLLRTVGRGQEFILDADDYREIYQLLKTFFRNCKN